MDLRLYAGDELRCQGARVLGGVQPVEEGVVAEPGLLIGAQPPRLGLHRRQHLQLHCAARCLSE